MTALADTPATMVVLRRPEFIHLNKKVSGDFDEADQVEERHPAATAVYAIVAILVLFTTLAIVSAVGRLVGSRPASAPNSIVR